MSKSRSSTPPIKKPLGEDTNNPTLDAFTTAGSTRPHDFSSRTPSNLPSRTEPPSAFPPSYIPPPAPPVPSLRPTPIRGTIRKADTDFEEGAPMAKRIRRDSLEPHPSQERHHHDHHRGDSRSSPSSDSQSGMADTEVDQKKTGESATSLGSTTQKKKRTRTLTTPHQAAVLHALLAQSRFPTTAMREEVGRAIGLSARKVQIWFQNQRQKARRPRSQGDAPTSRPPQYGPFPSSGMGVYSPTNQLRLPSSHPYTVAGPSRLRSPDLTRDERYYRSAPLPREAPLTPITEGDAPRLLGPGMPGYQASRHRHSHSYGRELPSSAPPTDSFFSSEPLRRFASPSSSSTSPLMQPTVMLRPVTSQALQRREWDPSRTLPPLVRSRPSTSSYPFSHRDPQVYHSRPASPAPVMPPIQPQRSSSPERRFAHQVPDLHTGQTVTLPPPFTLQPAPQWNPASYGASVARLSPDAWSRPSSRSTHPQSLPPSASSLRQDYHGPEQHHHDSSTTNLRNLPESRTTPPPPSVPIGSGLPAADEPSPPTRPGRYDPIREVFVPFTSTVTTTTDTQTRNRSSDDKNHTSDEQ